MSVSVVVVAVAVLVPGRSLPSAPRAPLSIEHTPHARFLCVNHTLCHASHFCVRLNRELNPLYRTHSCCGRVFQPPLLPIPYFPVHRTPWARSFGC